MDFTKQENLPVIARLGGFHLLKFDPGSMSNIMQYSRLLEVIQLSYHWSTTANHILDGGGFDKEILVHLLINAAIYPHLMKPSSIEEELGDMRSFTENVANDKMGTRHTDPVVALFEKGFEEPFKRLAEGGRTATVWVQYHHMVDMINIYHYHDI